MSLPAADRVNPREVAAEAAMSGRFHDVVVSASKVVHDVSLGPGDQTTLRWARHLLRSASKQVMLSMPSAQELAGPGHAVLVIRRAARPGDGQDLDENLSHLRTSIEKVLDGQRDPELLDAMNALRNLFSLVSRIALQSEVIREGERSPSGSWPTSTTTSHS